MTRIRDACPVCDSPSWTPYAVARGMEAVRCAGCSLVYARAVAAGGKALPSPEVRYNERYFERYLRRDGYRRRLAASRRRLRWLQGYAGRGRLLDVGCSAGYFVEAARALGWDAWGIEPSRFAAELARRRGAPVVQAALPEAGLAAESFDVLTLWHVIEHLADVRANIRESRRILKPTGILCALTPNIEHPMARLSGSRWKHLRAEHLQLFSHHTLPAFLRRSGFQVVCCRWLSRHSEVLVIARKA